MPREREGGSGFCCGHLQPCWMGKQWAWQKPQHMCDSSEHFRLQQGGEWQADANPAALKVGGVGRSSEEAQELGGPRQPNRDPSSWSSEGDALFQKVLPSAWSSVRGPQCGIVRPRRGPDAGHRFDLVLGGARLLTPRTPLGPSSMAGDIEGPRGSSVQHREMMYGLLTRV